MDPACSSVDMLSATTSPDAAATADLKGSELGTTLLLVAASVLLPPVPVQDTHQSLLR